MRTITTVLISLFTSSAVLAQPSDEQIRTMFAECSLHRTKPPQLNQDPRFQLPATTNLKSWEPGWEDCSTVQDYNDEMEARNTAQQTEQRKNNLKSFMQQVPKR